MKYKNKLGRRYRTRHGEGDAVREEEKACVRTKMGPHTRPVVRGRGAAKKRMAERFAQVHGRRL